VERWVSGFNRMITFRFHYPRNDILFVAPLTKSPEYYDHVVTEWAMGKLCSRVMSVFANAISACSRDRHPRRT